MGLESANNFDQLDKTWPLLGDSMRQTGGHIRLIKSVLKTIFPGLAGDGFAIPIASTEEELDRTIGLASNIQPQLNTLSSNSILISGFIPYSGALSGIPANYQLCDGTNGTPDLTDSFIQGTVAQAELGQTGGIADKIIPAHFHTINHFHSVTLTVDGEHTHDVTTVEFDSPGGPTRLSGSSPVTVAGTPQTDPGGIHNHTITIDNKIFNTSIDGASATDTNNPAWVKLAFIMRIT